MKHKLFLCAAVLTACAFSMKVNAQMYIGSTGKVAIGVSDSNEPLSQLSVGSVGNANAELSVYKNGTYSGTQYGIMSHLDLNPHSGTISSIAGKCTGGATHMIGVYGESLADNALIAFPSGAIIWPTVYGVYGIAGGSTRENFGVYGTLKDNVTAGAGVFGTINGIEPILNERYAGYFKGKTKVNGDFYALTLNTFTNPFPLSSIQGIDAETSSKILSVTPVQYHFKDTIETNLRIHYGLDVDEMKKKFPDLVYEGNEGEISINYVELIPLLVQTVQELSAKVEKLERTQRK